MGVTAGLGIRVRMIGHGECWKYPRSTENISRSALLQQGLSGADSSGEVTIRKLTAAHRTLPLGTHLLVTDPKTHRSVTVVVNDRGPFTKGRVLDLSLAAAKELRMINRGLIKVTAAVQCEAAY